MRNGYWSRPDLLVAQRPQTGIKPDAQVADKICIRAPMVVSDGGPAGGRLFQALAERGSFELLLLQATVPDEGSNDNGVRYGSGSEDLEGGQQGAILLGSSVGDDGRYPVAGNGHQNERESEEQRQGDLAARGHGGQLDDGDGEHDQEQVSDDVASPHGDELRIALATLRPRVRGDLPVVVEGLALGQGGDDHGDEGDCEEEADNLEDILERTPPDLRRDASQEFGNGELGRPYAVYPTLDAV